MVDYLLSKELRLAFHVILVYCLFIQWGYLQEKITSSEYVNDTNQAIMLWSYPFALNFVMAVAAVIVAAISELLISGSQENKSNKQIAPFNAYWRAALTNTIASPIGYASLNYISFPLMVLTKSSKPVPVMLIGVFYYYKKYTWYKYLSVALICLGIALFSTAKKSSSSSDDDSSSKLFIGIILVLVNLTLDGYTNNEQDAIFTNFESTSLRLMKNINIWQAIFLLIILIVLYLSYGNNSELYLAVNMVKSNVLLRYDILKFCLCSSLGQVLIFSIMKEFGSLAWVTISVTRKLFTILVSVIMFNHPVKFIQWFGVISVFAGMILEIYMSSKEKAIAKEKKSS